MATNRVWGSLIVAGLLSALPARGDNSIALSCPSQAAAGHSVSCWLTLSLEAGVSVDSLTFAVTVTPNGQAPALTSGQLSFVDLVGNGFSGTGGTFNVMSVVWADLSPVLHGPAQLGAVGFTIPAAAASANTYTARITGASASLGNNTVSLTLGQAAPITIVPVLSCAVTGDSSVTVEDIQLEINEALRVALPLHDLDNDQKVTASDVVIVAKAALGLGCAAI